MARVLNGTTQYMTASSTLLSNEVIIMLGWGFPNNITADMTIVNLGNNAATGRYTLNYNGSVAGDPVRAIKDNDAGSGAVIAATPSGYSASVWSHVVGAFRSDSSRAVYLNGGTKGTNATARTDPTPDFITVGAHRLSTVSQYFDGSLADVFMLDADITDAQVALIAQGIHPIEACVPMSNIRAWYPLLADDSNSMGGGYPDLSPVASPSFGSHPAAVMYPKIGGLISM